MKRKVSEFFLTTRTSQGSIVSSLVTRVNVYTVYTADLWADLFLNESACLWCVCVCVLSLLRRFMHAHTAEILEIHSCQWRGIWPAAAETYDSADLFSTTESLT